jgi:hypothetical protein
MNVADLALLVTLRAAAAKPVIPQFPAPAVRKVTGYALSR